MLEYFTMIDRKYEAQLCKKLQTNFTYYLDKRSEWFTKETLQIIHKEIIIQPDMIWMGWIFRPVAVHAGDQDFCSPRDIPRLLDDMFCIERHTPGEVIALMIDIIRIVHPFIDGNRRVCWSLVNYWLNQHDYGFLPWDQIRSIWEADIPKNYPTDIWVNKLIKDFLQLI